MKVMEHYGRAIENSDEHLFKEIFASQGRVEIPAGAPGEVTIRYCFNVVMTYWIAAARTV